MIRTRLVGLDRRSFSSLARKSVASFVASADDPSGAEQHVVSGWVRTVRVHKNVSFLTINDGSTHKSLQVVVPSAMVKPLVPHGLNTGASVKCVGKRTMSREGKVDMTADSLEMLGDALEFPLQKKEHTGEYLRDHLHLRARTDTFSSVMRVRSVCAASLRRTLESQGYMWVSTPILTGNDCEGAGELFKVAQTKSNEPFFGTPNVFLTVSGQLHSEMFTHGLSKVYTFGPTFRAENSNTTRHLAEFWMLEPEIAFANAQDAASVAESCLKGVVQDALEKCNEDLAFLETVEGSNRGKDIGGLRGRLERCLTQRFVQMDYFEACSILERKSSLPVEPRASLGSNHERFLVENHCGGTPVFVFNYPQEIKPFYALSNDDENKTSACFDMLVSGIGELVGGSAREHRYQVLEQRMRHDDLLPSLQWYLDLRKYGTVPHAGWGMGFERCVQFITGSDNIRDVIPVPRYPGSIRY